MYSLLVTKAAQGSAVWDTLLKWGVVCRSFPFRRYADMKEIPSHDWEDEDGEEACFPASMKAKAYDIDVEFAYRGTHGSANAQVKSFIDYLTGRDQAGGTSLKIYDTYTGIGRQKLWVKSVGDTVLYRRESESDIVTFSVTFRVTDPVTDVTLSLPQQ